MNKNPETWWVSPEFARQNPPLVCKRTKAQARSAFLDQYGPAFSVGRSHPQCVCFCRACESYCVADESAVRSGRTISCGCKQTIHGLSGDGQKNQTYRQWRVMRRRHRDGIKVQPEWFEDVKTLIKDLGEAPDGNVLREIVAGGGYVRNNVRWVTPDDAKHIHTRRKAKRVRISKAQSKAAIKGLPLYGATAACTRCGSYSTSTIATQPANGTRYHECHEKKCGVKFYTRMIELVAEMEQDSQTKVESEEVMSGNVE